MCPQCIEPGRPIYRMMFLVKDDSTLATDKINKLHFYTYNSFCEDFFHGLKPVNLYKDPVALQKIKDYVGLLSKFNVYTDMVIRKKYSKKTNEDIFELYDSKCIKI